jgi:hypothetical protein
MNLASLLFIGWLEEKYSRGETFVSQAGRQMDGRFAKNLES